MAIQAFAPGQRWISNSESELGLGLVEDCVGRRVSVRFPAAQQERTYATDNAPLTRVLYPLGETVSTVSGERLTVTARSEHGLLIRYTGTDEHGAVHTIDEAQLDPFARFSRPQDRLLAGQMDPNSHFMLRVETLRQRHRHSCCAAYGLLGARVALLPHQLYIAMQVGARHAPRVLLADEVGLGKTIEAGLIVHQQLVTGRASRVLFVVPDSLVHQWLVEMLRRFNLRLTILDEERCVAIDESNDGNPFDSTQLALCPLSLLADDPLRVQQASAAGWDLLVVDEAHHLEWSEQAASPAYRAIEALSADVPGLLLLTATPEQLGAEGHFARLRLLDPDRYPDAVQFREEQAGYQAISVLVQQLLDGAAGTGAALAASVIDGVATYLGRARADDFRLSLDADDAQSAVTQVVRALLDRHGTGRVLFRNTRDAVGGFAPRVLMPQLLDAAADDVLSDGLDGLQRMLNPVHVLGEGWPRGEPKVAWLERFIRDDPHKRTLVICAQAETARSLEEHLRLRAGLRTAVFYEGTSLLVRDRAAAYFAEPGADGAQALICSEIGSEGRNFQHASRLVLFDLPLDPQLLEQRIGRLDRIGQLHEVEIHVPLYATGAEHVLLRWYHQGLNAFERSCAIGERMRELFATRLAHCLAATSAATADAMLDTLVIDTRAAAQAMNDELEQGRDRLLEFGSCDPQQADQVVQDLVDGARSAELATYMESVFDLFGVEHEVDGAHSIVIHPGAHMICDEFPELPEDGITATFHRQHALAREDVSFLSWEHPLVTGAMGRLLDGEFGNASLCTLKALPLKAGTLLLEGIFVVHCPGPRRLGLNRYLPLDMVRHVVSGDGQDLSEALTARTLDRRASPVGRDTARELVRHAWLQIEKLVAHAQRLASAGQTAIIDAAVESAAHGHAVELERLRALAAVNPNIRVQEVMLLEKHAQDVGSHLQGAQLRLDAIRVGIVT
ncbi:MAG: ATP-dependent helicase HepA [Gammaproteobacteria bacterium]|jgi:ATP-dependent helicase HepA